MITTAMTRFFAITMCALSVTTCAVAYLTGRYGFSLPIPPVVPAFLLYLTVTCLYLIASIDVTRSWKGWIGTLLLTGGMFMAVCLPSVLGDGYLEMGRRAHIKSIFSQDVINDIKTRVRQIAVSGTRGTEGELTADDLPSVVSESGWRFPGHASFAYEPATQKVHVRLDWGGALIAHHGILITDEVIPFEGYPTHSEDENGKTIETYSQKYYPWVEGSYIVIDEN